MKVTVWHATNPRELFKVYEGVDRVEGDDRSGIALYTRWRSDTDPGQMLASFGPGECWAIEAEETA